MECPLILLRFWGIFIHFIDEHWCLKYIKTTKHSQIDCWTPFNVHLLLCQNTKCDCSLWKVLWFNCVFGYFYMKRYNFIKLLQTFLNKLTYYFFRFRAFVQHLITRLYIKFPLKQKLIFFSHLFRSTFNHDNAGKNSNHFVVILSFYEFHNIV